MHIYKKHPLYVLVHSNAHKTYFAETSFHTVNRVGDILWKLKSKIEILKYIKEQVTGM